MWEGLLPERCCVLSLALVLVDAQSHMVQLQTIRFKSNSELNDVMWLSYTTEASHAITV